jgi:hypothetical protein
LQKIVALIITDGSNQFVLEESEMHKNNENIYQGTEMALALVVLLLNFLILAAVVGIVWSMQLLIAPGASLSIAVGETLWR